MKTQLCYIIHTRFDENFEVRKTLKESLEIIVKENRASYYIDNSSPIEIQYDDNSKEDIDIKQYIEKIELIIEDLKNIEDLIDEEIKKTEILMNDMFKESKGAMITGWFGITKDRREWAIQNEIKTRSYKWKELNFN